MERYFKVNGITEDEKLFAVAVCLEGRALTWYQWLETRSPIKKALFGRFQGPRMGDLYERVMALRQVSTVDSYREEFEALTAPLKNASEEVLVGAFKNGLKPEIQAELHLFSPTHLQTLWAWPNA